ncbi:methionyl-tRNA formyltransferase [Advenella sp. WQ 585]|uniref:Methionyl-tRNA formyltransferase n=1 Tax=Advenella mandrilli TaxID=2800330 RepID=A0ABS1EEN0_9BURK|nr:methionyl-tRNA formyltransferase [Advenella mandrilli]MBK1781259.1 methionyl-tRNA formyltransferase [Advenella mandrilli]
MRVVFAGTPEFARLAYEAIIKAGHDVPLVLTQPDRPSGRGLKLTPSPVKQEAVAQGAQVLQPQSLRLDGKYPDEARQTQQVLQALAPDVMVVAAYGLILPQWVLDLPKYGCLNIHASLLPRWRGAAPIQRAIEAGDAQTGVAIMQMDAGLDTGDVLLEKRVDITDQTAAVLHEQLATMGAECITAVLGKLGTGELKPVAQPEAGVTYAAKLEKSEAPININQDAQTIARRIRAFNPVPGATLLLPGLKDPVKVWQAVALHEATSAEPGTVLRATADGVDIATGQGVLRLLELQKAGGKRQPVAVFVTGWKP